jgi:hypothetical protein
MTMQSHLTNFELALYALGYFMLFAALLLVSYYPPKDGGPALVAWLFTALGTLSGHMLGNVRGKRAHAPTDVPARMTRAAGQAGRAMIPLLLLIAVLSVFLTGCAGFTQALRGYESAAYEGMKAANDNTLEIVTVALCATPVSTALRNPSKIAAIKAACMNGSQDPASLFDGKQQAITINVTMPPAPAVPASAAAPASAAVKP